jgi:hypothetical protein
MFLPSAAYPARSGASVQGRGRGARGGASRASRRGGGGGRKRARGSRCRTPGERRYGSRSVARPRRVHVSLGLSGLGAWSLGQVFEVSRFIVRFQGGPRPPCPPTHCIRPWCAETLADPSEEARSSLEMCDMNRVREFGPMLITT